MKLSPFASLEKMWIKVYKENVRNLYTSPNITRVIKSRRIEGWGIAFVGR
jgi:hypothetical protein